MRRALVTAALVLSACGGAGTPTASPSPTAEAISSPTAPAAEPTGSATSGPIGESTIPAPRQTQDPGPAQPATDLAFVIASDDGVHRVDDAASVEVLHDPASVAFDDGEGGVVVQFSEGYHASTAEDTSIYHLREGAEGPVVIVEGNIDVDVLLHDVFATPRGAVAVFSTRRGDTPETARQELFTYDLGTGDTRLVAQVGGWESGADPISFGADRYALNASAEATSWIEFLDAGGERVRESANPLPPDAPCEDDVTCPDLAVIDPSGQRLAFTRFRQAADGVIRSWELVVLDLRTGTSVLEWEEPYEDGRGPQHVDVAGGLVVVSLGSADPEQRNWAEPLVFDLTGEEPTTSRLPIPGLATLAAD